ncbi:hypothetical protein FDP22_02395 [Paroceanicella profunda]|uniref:EF-hand domain-containing protein n=1 Tax=Paroceanicella profunda TaxID=2579971 RepID=A0A5B8FGD8_9RHOB|nr:EF-hand domain-containing protein [Paroceanicella profunda]QDL90738.1 hypothetical protein FDP22_02395 [Paroceanicella profunda]
MKTPLSATLALLVALSPLAAGAASSGGAGPQGHGPSGHGPAMFMKMDADGDGTVTRAEVDAFRKARFDAADANHDGEITRDELVASMTQRLEQERLDREKRRAEGMADRMMARADGNGDGVISAGEPPATFEDMMFRRFDTDGDGTISAQEAEAGQRMMHHHGGPRGGHDGPGPMRHGFADPRPAE